MKSRASVKMTGPAESRAWTLTAATGEARVGEGARRACRFVLRRERRESMTHSTPPLAAFTLAERRLISRLRTPRQVQDYLNRLPYNTEPPPGPGTLRGFRQVVRRHTAHCLEAALFAACVLEQHGFPPLLMSLKSLDLLDHVIFVYRQGGRWGSGARPRDPGLHGGQPGFRPARPPGLTH